MTDKNYLQVCLQTYKPTLHNIYSYYRLHNYSFNGRTIYCQLVKRQGI